MSVGIKVWVPKCSTTHEISCGQDSRCIFYFHSIYEVHHFCFNWNHFQYCWCYLFTQLICSALQLHVDLERLLEAISTVSLSTISPHPYRSPPFFRNCPEFSEHCNFVLPLTGWRLQHCSSNQRIACDPVVLDVRTVLILQVPFFHAQGISLELQS